MEALPATVQVYRNIHKSRSAGRTVYSIRDAKTRRVVGHTDRIVLADAVFVVGETGRRRVLAEGRKNVHAYVQGTPVDAVVDEGVAVTYNPYLYETFVMEGFPDAPVHRAALVELAGRVRAQGATA